ANRAAVSALSPGPCVHQRSVRNPWWLWRPGAALASCRGLGADRVADRGLSGEPAHGAGRCADRGVGHAAPAPVAALAVSAGVHRLGLLVRYCPRTRSSREELTSPFKRRLRDVRSSATLHYSVLVPFHPRESS